MTDSNPTSDIHFVGYRIGDTLCLSPSTTIITIDELPRHLCQMPGTKPWLLGAGRLGRQLVPFINVTRFLNINRTSASKTAYTAICVKGNESTGDVGLVVDEVTEFVRASELRDYNGDGLKIPPGLGKSMRRAVTARGRTWALIDLRALIADEKLQTVDLI
ncbi:chemotaxis protein CheW [Pseudomonas guariconensis]|uniref:chemotaxis protein CheW n=1 Tax=Pseudomonas guariconensis TaxID=1288410 RepID=UPI0039063C47